MWKKRLDRELWANTRKEVHARDGGRCVHCGAEVGLDECHTDHIRPLSKGGGNHVDNLRTLCRRCHVLRRDTAHRGLIANALRDGIIPPKWRELTWDDEDEGRRMPTIMGGDNEPDPLERTTVDSGRPVHDRGLRP